MCCRGTVVVMWMVDIVVIFVWVVGVVGVVGVVWVVWVVWVVVITGFWVVVAMAVLFLQYVRFTRLPGSHRTNNESQTHTIRLTHIHSTHTHMRTHACVHACTHTPG